MAKHAKSKDEYIIINNTQNAAVDEYNSCLINAPEIKNRKWRNYRVRIIERRFAPLPFQRAGITIYNWRFIIVWLARPGQYIHFQKGAWLLPSKIRLSALIDRVTHVRKVKREVL